MEKFQIIATHFNSLIYTDFIEIKYADKFVW